MSDKLNGVFDGGFSGIFYEGKRKATMPNYLEELAEREAGLINPDAVTPIDLDFNINVGLERAAELNNDECRTIQSRKVKAKDFRKEIESSVEDLLSEGQEPQDIERILNRKYPPSQVKNFFEANSSSILTKYSELVPSYIGFVPYKISRQIEDSLQQHKSRLKTENAFKVCSSFCSYLKNLKSFLGKNDVEEKVAFKRDNDQKEMKERQVENNVSRNEKVAKNISLENIHQEFKSYIQSGLSKKEAHSKLVKKFTVSQIENFYSKYASDINKLEKFVNRETFDTDFKKITVESTNKAMDEFESKDSQYKENQMMNFSFRLMTEGKNLKEIKEALKKTFEYKHAKKFIESNSRVLEKHYGQLGYIFIDSNVYDNCDKMRDSYRKISHVGKQLIYSVKENKKCKLCSENKEGTCIKTGLTISQNPLVRSLRAAKQVLVKASSFVSRDYIKQFQSKISDNGNMKLISDFTLGMKKVSRENFDTDFNKISVKSNNKAMDEFESKIPEYQEKQMLNFSFKLMTEGRNLDEIKEALKKTFEYKHAKKFIESNARTLEKHYGQLGYVFIDSNVYDNCNVMKDSYQKISHIGKQLMYSIKANKKCKSCSDNKEGTCNKTGLMISNHPLVRSSRATKRVLAKASSFIPKTYIEQFQSKISEDGNMKLVSNFTLGMKKSLEDDRKNIGKKATKQPMDLSAQMGFEAVESNADLFKKSNKSKIIDEILRNE